MDRYKYLATSTSTAIDVPDGTGAVTRVQGRVPAHAGSYLECFRVQHEEDINYVV